MARAFNGTNQAFALANNAALTLGDDTDSSGPFSVVGWMKATGMADGNGHAIMRWGDSAPSFQISVYGSTSATVPGFVECDLFSGQNIYYRPSGQASWIDDTWHHLALVGSGSTLILYRDGSPYSSTSMATLDAINRDDVMYFGRRASGAAGYWFGGSLAEWAKFDVALTTGQIAALVDGESPRAVGTPSWHISMLGGLVESVSNITITDTNTSDTTHPPRMYAPRRRKLHLLENAL